jgi:hypothetical protein
MTCDSFPSWSDFAVTPDASDAPGLWQGLAGFWCPALGRSGDRLLDLSGRRHHAALMNMDAAAWSPGRDASTLLFDGVDDFANLGDPEDLRFSDTFTLVWYGYASSSGQGSSALLGKGGYQQQRACGLQLYADTLYASQAADGNTADSCSVAISRNYPAADMLVATYEPGKRIGVYQNGRLVGEKTSGVYAQFYHANGLPWCLMTRGDAAAVTAGGVLYAMLYQRALAAGEIVRLAADPLGLLRRRRRRTVAARRALGSSARLAAGQLFYSGAAGGCTFTNGTVQGAIYG